MKLYSTNPYAQRNWYVAHEWGKAAYPCPACESLQVQLMSYSSPAKFRCREVKCRTWFEWEPKDSPYAKDWSPDDFEIVGDEYLRRQEGAAPEAKLLLLPPESGREQEVSQEARNEGSEVQGREEGDDSTCVKKSETSGS